MDSAMEAAAQMLQDDMEHFRGVTMNASEWDQVAASCVRAYLAAKEAAGFVMVPVEPTEAMMDAGDAAGEGYREPYSPPIYAAMIAARPREEDR